MVLSGSGNGYLGCQARLGGSSSSLAHITNLPSEGRENLTKGYQCLMADGPLDRITKKILLLKELNGLGIQLIMTASPLVDIVTLPKDVNIIYTEKALHRFA